MELSEEDNNDMKIKIDLLRNELGGQKEINIKKKLNMDIIGEEFIPSLKWGLVRFEKNHLRHKEKKLKLRKARAKLFKKRKKLQKEQLDYLLMLLEENKEEQSLRFFKS